MNEILNGIRVIKMYAWEHSFTQLVDAARMKELHQLRFRSFYQALILGIFYAAGKLSLLCAVAAYTIFVASALFSAARLTVSLFLPFAVQSYSEIMVTLKRIQAFLLLDERRFASQNRGLDARKTVSFGQTDNDVIMDKFYAKYDPSSDTFALSDISFKVKRGQLLAIVGPVGSGKSSVLTSLIGETVRVGGTATVSGRIAYVPQEAWLFSGTIRQNILFGRSYNPSQYQKTIEAACLLEDLKQLRDGDLTLVGDKGASLSGGQKARINLARALYSDADVFLLDDPLSAVDPAVGNFLFER
ncbi:unnamed protein product [Soboliphyme baturini]|uniref:ABC transmembrane type-1 domain-containing protein n=1 Tax=Soboliphyme baturini TaxID=241478 RepID=A0A183IG08_9BILA|nr:unnamed protein product [Soboliphyme baturini]